VPAALSYRLGPELTQVFEWESNSHQWRACAGVLDDGFPAYCHGYAAAGPQLTAAHFTSPLAVERIVELTGGKFASEQTWYKADRLKTARMDYSEIVQRITTTQDPDGEMARHDGVSKVQALAALKGNIPFRRPLEDLKAEFSFSWTNLHPHCNVVSVAVESLPATLIYAGIGNRSDQLAALYAKTSDLARRGDYPDRFGVVYQEGTQVMVYSPPILNPINSTATRGNNFTEPEK